MDSKSDQTAEERLLLEAIAARATDIHIDPLTEAYCVRFRIDGILRVRRTLSRGEGENLVNQIKANAGIDPGTVFHPVGMREKWNLRGESIDFRVTLVPCVSGPKIAIRVLDLNRIERRLSHLGLQDRDRDCLECWASELNGMILVTGPTASGKTSTVYALLHDLANESRHVITVEDPVEYEINGINQIQVDERHNVGFAEGIRASLRLDPDCLMVGEIREAEAAIQSVNAAVQGHVVLATMHSRDAASAITRLRNFGLHDHQISAALGVLVNQRLVRKLCRECVEMRDATDEERSFFEHRGLSAPERAGTAPGCDACDGVGYHGRTGIFEVWNLQEPEYDAILKGKDERYLREEVDKEDYTSLLSDARAKVESGVTSVAELIRTHTDLPWQAG